MPGTEQKMAPSQIAGLVDGALRSPHPLAFFDSAVVTFRMLGRYADSTTAAWIGCLYADGEIEALMNLRAAWRRGEDPSPVQVGEDDFDGKP